MKEDADELSVAISLATVDLRHHQEDHVAVAVVLMLKAHFRRIGLLLAEARNLAIARLVSATGGVEVRPQRLVFIEGGFAWKTLHPA